MSKYCGNCQHFDSKIGTTGICRRYPPQAVYRGYMLKEPEFSSPRTQRTDVCGEWAPNAEARAREEAELEKVIKEVFEP